MAGNAKHALSMVHGEKLADEMMGSEVRDAAMTYDEFVTSSYASEMKRRFDYYMGNQFMMSPTTTDLLPYGNQITPDEWNASLTGYGWDDIRAMLPDATREQCIHPVGIPFVTICVDNRQVVYTVPPETRTIYKNNKPDAKASELLKKIYSGARHDHLADQLCKWTGLFDTAFQFVGWDVRNKRIIKRNLRPFEVFVIPALDAPDDLQHPDCFVAIAQMDQGLTDRSAMQRPLVWQCWWKDRFWYESEPRSEFKNLECTIPGTMPNPYRDDENNPVKPILVTHSKESSSVYFEGTDNLVLLNQRLDRDLTAISHTMEFQGFSMLMFTGMDVAEIRNISPSAGSAAALPQGATAEFLHPAIQIGEFFSAIINKARAFARMVGIDPELVDPKVEVQSGVAKSHGRRALAERREEQFPKWIPYERESYWITSQVWNYYAKEGKQLPEIPRFDTASSDDAWHIEVVFGELDPVVDPLADAQKIQTDLKNNLITRPMVLQARCRISAAAAEILAKKIKDYNSEDGLVPDFNAAQARIGQPGNRPENPDRPRDKTGGNISGASGNERIPLQPSSIRKNNGAGTT